MAETRHSVFLVRCYGGSYRGNPANVERHSWLVCALSADDAERIVHDGLGPHNRFGDIHYNLSVDRESPIPSGVAPEELEAMFRILQPFTEWPCDWKRKGWSY
jgi:hypothetical protein